MEYLITSGYNLNIVEDLKNNKVIVHYIRRSNYGYIRS